MKKDNQKYLAGLTIKNKYESLAQIYDAELHNKAKKKAKRVKKEFKATAFTNELKSNLKMFKVLRTVTDTYNKRSKSSEAIESSDNNTSVDKYSVRKPKLNDVSKYNDLSNGSKSGSKSPLINENSHRDFILNENFIINTPIIGETRDYKLRVESLLQTSETILQFQNELNNQFNNDTILRDNFTKLDNMDINIIDNKNNSKEPKQKKLVKQKKVYKDSILNFYLNSNNKYLLNTRNNNEKTLNDKRNDPYAKFSHGKKNRKIIRNCKTMYDRKYSENQPRTNENSIDENTKRERNKSPKELQNFMQIDDTSSTVNKRAEKNSGDYKVKTLMNFYNLKNEDLLIDINALESNNLSKTSEYFIATPDMPPSVVREVNTTSKNTNSKTLNHNKSYLINSSMNYSTLKRRNLKKGNLTTSDFNDAKSYTFSMSKSQVNKRDNLISKIDIEDSNNNSTNRANNLEQHSSKNKFTKIKNINNTYKPFKSNSKDHSITNNNNSAKEENSNKRLENKSIQNKTKKLMINTTEEIFSYKQIPNRSSTLGKNVSDRSKENNRILHTMGNDDKDYEFHLNTKSKKYKKKTNRNMQLLTDNDIKTITNPKNRRIDSSRRKSFLLQKNSDMVNSKDRFVQNVNTETNKNNSNSNKKKYITNGSPSINNNAEINQGDITHKDSSEIPTEINGSNFFNNNHFKIDIASNINNNQQNILESEVFKTTNNFNSPVKVSGKISQQDLSNTGSRSICIKNDEALIKIIETSKELYDENNMIEEDLDSYNARNNFDTSMNIQTESQLNVEENVRESKHVTKRNKLDSNSILIKTDSAIDRDVVIQNDSVKDSSVINEEIKEFSAINESIKDNSFVNESIKDNTVINKSIKDNTVVNESIKDNTVINESIKDNTVINESIKDNTVINESIKDNTVINESIKENINKNDTLNTVDNRNQNDMSVGGSSISKSSKMGNVLKKLRKKVLTKKNAKNISGLGLLSMINDKKYQENPFKTEGEQISNSQDQTIKTVFENIRTEPIREISEKSQKNSNNDIKEELLFTSHGSNNQSKKSNNIIPSRKTINYDDNISYATNIKEDIIQEELVDSTKNIKEEIEEADNISQEFDMKNALSDSPKKKNSEIITGREIRDEIMNKSIEVMQSKNMKNSKIISINHSQFK